MHNSIIEKCNYLLSPLDILTWCQKMVRVGILQLGYSIDPYKNLEKTVKYINSFYKDADIVVLPEYSMMDILQMSPREVYSRSEHIEDSKYLGVLAKLAMDLNTNILAHFIEKTSQEPYTYSTSVLITNSGTLIPVYRKMHLFDAYGFKESNYFLPGKELFKEIAIKETKFRVAICFDLRFPELFRLYAYLGAHGILIHSGWVRGPLKEEILEFLVKTRAHENTYWVIVSDHYGKNYVGRSMIVDPYGVKVIDLGIGEKYIEYDIDISLINDARRIVPVIDISKRKWVIKQKDADKTIHP